MDAATEAQKDKKTQQETKQGNKDEGRKGARTSRKTNKSKAKTATTKKAEKTDIVPAEDLKAEENVETCATESESCCGSAVTYVIGFLILLVLGAAAYNMLGAKTSSSPEVQTSTTLVQTGMPAKVGDIVSVDYTGRLENGTVFDTSVKTLAEEAGIYNPLRPYQPLVFTLGSGDLIPAFEKAIIGMNAGDEKEFKVPYSEGYGARSEKAIQKIERKQRSPSTQNVTRQRFVEEIGKEPYVGLEFTVPETEGFKLDWPIKVLAVSDDTVTFKYQAGEKTTIDTVFGPSEVYGEGDEIVIELTAQKGQKILTLDGPAEIADVDESYITIDFNHPLANKDLYFWVKLVSVAETD